MEYHFNVEIAKKYGSDCATIIHNLAFWQKKNQANNINLHASLYWTYNSARAFSELFPWISEQKMKRYLKSLEEAGVLKSGNFNKSAYDRTKWYTVIDKKICEIYELSIVNNETIHCSNLTNGLVINDRPIPYNKPDSNPNNKTIYTPEFESFWKSSTKTGSKRNAFKEYKKVIGSVDNQILIDAYEKQLFEDHFKGSDGKDYIPHVERWLKNARWEDEVKQSKKNKFLYGE